MKTIKTLSLLLLAVLLFAAWLHTPVEAAADPILLGDADVNGDGSVGADDAARILRCFIGLTDDLA